MRGGNGLATPETFYWNGSLKFAAITKDDKLLKLLQNKFNILMTSEKELLPIKNHVDLNMFGSLPLELYQITKEKQYKDLGIPYADTQWQVPTDAKPEEKAG